MVVGIGGIGQFRDPGDPNDPRRGTSRPQENAAPGLPTGMTGGFDFEAWERRQRGEPEPAQSSAQPSFEQMAAALSQQQEQYTPETDAPARRMPAGVSRNEFNSAVAAAEAQRSLVTQLQASQSPRESAAVLSQITGLNVSDAVAERTTQLLSQPDFNLDATTAVRAAQVQAGEARATPELIAAIENAANQAEIEPADGYLNRNLRDGSEEIDFDNPATAQAQSAYEDLQDEVEQGFYQRQNALQELDRNERRQVNAESGQGSRINGRANPFDKEKFEAMSPFQVPVIVGDQRVNARGEVAAPQITTQFKNGKPTTLLDAAQARLALLNPAALLPQEFAENFGYTRTRTKPQTVTGSYSKTPDVPTVDPSSFVVDEDGTRRYGGFAPYDDPAYTNGPTGERDVNAGQPRYVEQAPMTLGQAVDFVMNQHKTPVKTYGYDMIEQIAGDTYVRNEDGTRGPKIYALKNQRAEDEEAGLTAYRVGSQKMFDDGFEPELVRLIQGATGGQFITDQPQTVVEAPNGQARVGDTAQTRMVGGERLYVGEKIGLYDKAIREQQAQLLIDSFDAEMLGKYAEDLPADSRKSMMAVASLLAKGRNLPADDGAQLIADYPSGNTDFASASTSSADQQALQKLGEQRNAAAKRNRVRQKFEPENRTPLPASTEVQALLAMEEEMAQAQAALRTEYEIQEREARHAVEAAAASEQNTRAPQSVETGVMNTDDVSMLNAPEPPRIKDEPTPRMQQIGASGQSGATNSVADGRGMEFLNRFLGQVRRNPMRSAAAAAGTGLAALGAAPYDPREDE